MKTLLCYLVYSLTINALFSGFIDAQTYEEKTIEAENFTYKIERTGKLVFKRTLNLSFKTNGFLAELNVDEGDSFKQGQILAELDKFELIAEKNSSYASLLQAKQDVQRTELLLAKKLSSQQALDNANTLVETTRSRYKVAQYNLVKAQLIAPFDGVVLSRFSELGELQSPNQAALRLAALTHNLVARVAITTDEMSWVSIGQSVQVNLAQLGSVTGIISKIPAIADQQSQLFSIEILLSDINAMSVAVGQFVDVTINTTSDNYVYKLPISALNSIDISGDALITVRNNNTMQNNNEPKYGKKSFKIIKLTNDFIYLNASRTSHPLTVVSTGWQKIVDNSTQNKS